MSGIDALRARHAEAVAIAEMLDRRGWLAAAMVVHERARAWSAAVATVKPDYAGDVDGEEASGEQEHEQPVEEEEAAGEADEEEPDDAVLAPAAAIRAWADKHGVAVTRGGFIGAAQLAAINAKRRAMDLGPFVVSRA